MTNARDRDIIVRCPETVPDEDPSSALTLILRKLRPLGPPPGLAMERALASRLAFEWDARALGAIPFHVFQDRPAVEPTLRAAWPRLMGSTTVDDIDGIVTALLGTLAKRRTGEGATERKSTGTRSVFPSAPEASEWLNRIDAVERTTVDPFGLACFAYAQTVLSHPYEDGNGRLARVMYQRSLARSGLLVGPILPLGPLVYANHQLHDRALEHLGATGDWLPFTTVLTALTRKAVAFVNHAVASVP